MNAVTRIAAAAALLLGLQGCFFSPGEFDSSLDLRSDGSFTFTYVGELHFIALSDMATRRGEFSPSTCHDDETYEERECTAEELEEQRAAWERRKENDAREAQQMSAMFGGLDPSDPEAAQEFADKLLKQRGWRRVEYRGDGLFDVSYSIASYAGHGFAFPAIEGFPMANQFVQFTPRNDGSIRIDAPGFGPNTSNPMGTMMFGASELGGQSEDMPKLPKIDGRFTITADGAILANNTEDGPQPDERGQRLSWPINERTTAAPMALVRPGG